MAEPPELIDRDFILAEYQRIASDLLANESMGDNRMNVYATLWAAGAGGTIAYLSQKHDLAHLRAPLVMALSALAVLGVVTLLRLQKRDTHTDKLIDTLGRLRVLLVRSESLMEAALPWGSASIKEKRSLLSGFGVLWGALLLTAGTAALISVVIWDTWRAAFIAFSCAAVVEYAWLSTQYEKAHAERRKQAAKFSEALGAKSDGGTRALPRSPKE